MVTVSHNACIGFTVQLVVEKTPSLHLSPGGFSNEALAGTFFCKRGEKVQSDLGLQHAGPSFVNDI